MLASVDDGVRSAIMTAVRHALTHVDVVKSDVDRLQKRTGCCLPASDGVTGLPCCAPAGTRNASGRAAV